MNIKALKEVEIFRVHYELNGGNEYTYEIGVNCDKILGGNDHYGIGYVDVYKDDCQISLLNNSCILKIDYRPLQS